MKEKITLKDLSHHSTDMSKQPINFRPLHYPANCLAWFYVKALPFVTPNQISILWGIMGIVACLVMTLGGYWNLVIGLSIYYFALLHDYIDGRISRVKKMSTIGGTYLDRFSHYVHRSLLLVGLGIGVYNTNGQIIYLYLGVGAGLLFAFDNLAKLKVYETFVNKNKFDLMKEQKDKFEEEGIQIFHKEKTTLYQTIKGYAFESLRPNNPFSLLTFSIIFNIPQYYLILMAIVTPVFFVRTFVNIYKRIGNIPG